MEQPTATQPIDLRDLRTRFLDKQLAYALSFQYRHLHVANRVHELVRDNKDTRSLRRELEVKHGEVFHVFDDDRVAGLDRTGRDVPRSFTILGLQETLTLTESAKPGLASSAIVEGRMLFEAPPTSDAPRESTYAEIGPLAPRTAHAEMSDGLPVRISVSYDGVLRFEEPVALDSFPKNPARASGYIVPLFEAIHPRYHWLTENVCIAYGTWELDAAGAVAASFDVYSVE